MLDALRGYFARAAAWAAFAGGSFAAALLVLGAIEARTRVRAEPRFDLSSWTLRVGDLPDWTPRELREEIASFRFGAAAASPLTVFTPRVLSRVRQELLECVWIREVRRMRPLYPGLPDHGLCGSPRGPAAGGSIELEVELRVPIALVSAGGSLYLTDREGVRLGPAVSAARAAELALPAIVGGEGRVPRRPPPPGAAWEERDVREGLEVARVLHDAGIREEFPQPAIESIDIRNIRERSRAGECEIVLAAGDLRLGWGRSPISQGARTLPVGEVLQNLRRALRKPEAVPGSHLALLYTRPMVCAPSASR